MTSLVPATTGPSLSLRPRGARLRASEVALALVPLLVGGAIGGLITAEAIPTWYRLLDKPAWNPPDWVFGPVWTGLYLLIGAAWVIARRSSQGATQGRVDALFCVQLGLNLGWSVVFFGLRDIGGGLTAIGLLWLVIAVTTIQFWRVRRAAGALFVPYLAWVSFASLLNAAIWQLNAGPA